MTHKLRLFLSIWLVALTATGQTPVAGLPKFVPPAVPSITFLPGSGPVAVRSSNANNAAIDFGSISFASGNRTPVQVVRTARGSLVSADFIIRIDGTTTGTGRATVWASIQDLDPSVTISVDGVRLSTIPRALETQVFGIPAGHHLELEIPTSVPAGRIGSTISWEVTVS